MVLEKPAHNDKQLASSVIFAVILISRLRGAYRLLKIESAKYRDKTTAATHYIYPQLLLKRKTEKQQNFCFCQRDTLKTLLLVFEEIDDHHVIYSYPKAHIESISLYLYPVDR